MSESTCHSLIVTSMPQGCHAATFDLTIFQIFLLNKFKKYYLKIEYAIVVCAKKWNEISVVTHGT